jgi:multimeric flavodoxin WrbA
MESKPLVIVGSSRHASNTFTSVRKIFGEGDYRSINLLDYVVSPYNHQGKYPKKDQFMDILEEMIHHDRIILATPVYFYAMSGLMKCFIDRLYDLMGVQQDLAPSLEDKRLFVVASGTDHELPLGFETPFEKTAQHFKMNYKGCIYFSEKGSRLLRITKSTLEDELS